MAEASFYAIAVLSLVAAMGVVISRNIVYSALLLLVALSGVAGVFVILFAEFLALVQVLIYGGAIVIVILFAIMLTRVQDFRISGEHRQWPLAALLSAVLFVLMAIAFIGDAGLFNSSVRSGIDVETLGKVLFSYWAIPFEIASLVLLIALVGAIVVSRSEGGDRQ